MMHKHTAQGLASLGRGPDTELVHMTKGEVHGLQKLALAHGGSLTINPHTGLAEAGFLKSILPMVLGAGLAMIPGVGPLMAAGIVGGGTALTTGSLSKGLMAGLGAYGGAGIGAGLAGAGEAAIGSGMASTAEQTAMNSALGAPAAAPSFASNVSNMGQGFTGLGTEAERTAFTGQMGGGMGLAKTGAMAAAPVMANAVAPVTTPLPANSPGMIRPYTLTRTQNAQPNAIGTQYQPSQNTSERNWFKDTWTAGTPYAAPGPEYKTMADGGAVAPMPNNTGYPDSNIYVGDAAYANGGGISNLGGYSDGGQLLRGPGDGVSDSIPAMIGEKQKARLADGEFVVPARIVSELGNGSTEAGSRQLYAMMDRIQKARKKSTGKGNVAANTQAARLLPA